MEETNAMGQQGTQITNAQDQVYDIHGSSGNGGDSGIPGGVVTCYRCKLPLDPSVDMIIVYSDRMLHQDRIDCINKLRQALEEAGKELEQSRASHFFGTYNSTNDSSLLHAPLFIDIVKQFLVAYSQENNAAWRARVIDIAYKITNNRSAIQPSRSNYYFPGSSLEFQLAMEFVEWAKNPTNSITPEWLKGIV